METFEKHTHGMSCTISPGRGDLPVGQFEAQNLLPNGSGTPSLASSGMRRDVNKCVYTDNKEAVNTYLDLPGMRHMSFSKSAE